MTEAVTVEQIDREAAADLYTVNDISRQVILKGDFDDTPIVQAFARHRLASQRDPHAVESIPHHPLCSVKDGAACDYDCARDYKPTLPDAVEGESWQPIETAPRDGIEVMVYYRGQHHVAAYVSVWHPDNLRWCVRSPATPGNDDRRTVTDIDHFYIDGKALPDSCAPTHWQPLPAPPAAAIRKEPS